MFTADTRFFLIGSCFSDEVATRMRDHGLQVTANPFGTMYNPLSIAACIERLTNEDEQLFTKENLVKRDGLYHSWLHHGSFSHRTAEETLEAMNDALHQGRQALRDADVIVVTFGSAYVYERDGQVVANCHKFPNNGFNKRRIDIEEIQRAMTANVTNHPTLRDKTFIFTVSPIRHKGDGLTGNMLSKATLRVAADQLCQQSAHGERLYFPSFEIFMDELRDYRWYAADMLHPTPQAVDYIWERFCGTFFSAQEQEVLRQRHAAILLQRHRPLHE